MAITVVGSGTQAATVTTEHSLDIETAAGVYVLEVDCSAMVALDVLELRIKTNTLAAGTERTKVLAIFYGPPNEGDGLLQSIPIPHDATAANIEFTLKQTFGTSRSFPWKVLNIS